MAYWQNNPMHVGNMLVALSMDDMLARLDDPEIDMMIPYHAARVPKAVHQWQ